MRSKDAVGLFGEQLASQHLRSLGMQILAQRWRCSAGEIDVVAADGRELVICEVKTRRSHAAGHPLEAVTPTKVARLRSLAGAWLQAHDRGEGATGSGRFSEVRIDVVAITIPRQGGPQVEYLRAVT